MAEKKIRRIYRSSGSVAAAEWAKARGYISIFRRVEAEKLASRAHLLQNPLLPRTRKSSLPKENKASALVPNILDEWREELKTKEEA